MCNLNLNGARIDFERTTLFKLMDIKHIDIMLVQETYSCPNTESEWRRSF